MSDPNFQGASSVYSEQQLGQVMAARAKDDKKGKNGHKNHPIFEAIKAGLLIPVQTLFETMGSEIFSLRDDKGHTPAHWAALGGQTTILRFIIENKGQVNESSENELGAKPIHWACVNGHIAIVDILVQAGVSLDVTDNKGCTPLLVAAQYGQTMLAGYLMGKGARLQIVDKDGDNALHWAAFKGRSELMRLLIYSGFNPRQKDNYGQTPLHLACINGNLTAVKELCEQDGVEIDLPDKNGKTPVMLATGRKHDDVLSYLKKELNMKRSLLPKIDIWSIIFGPPGKSKGPLLFYIFNIVFWGYPMYIIKCLPVTWYDLQIAHILFILINCVMWVSLYHASTTDPGFLPRNIPEYDLAIKQVAHFDEWKQGQNPLSRLCHTCRTVKPIRAKHCKICERCVKEFDHHCPYIYNCVGYKNRVWFCSFIVTLITLGYMSAYMGYHVIAEFGWDWLVVLGVGEVGFFSVVLSGLTLLMYYAGVSFAIFTSCITINGYLTCYFSYHILSLEGWRFPPDYVIGIILLTIGGLISTFVCLGTLLHASANMTTNERINAKRYQYMKDGKGNFYNPFDKGVKNNLMTFFHLKKTSEEDIEFLNIKVV